MEGKIEKLPPDYWRKLMEDFWGWQEKPNNWLGVALHVKLPPTEQFPVMPKAPGLDMPPYLGAQMLGEKLHVDLWEGDGFRVGYGDRFGNGNKPSFIYADGENMPEEWKPIVGQAIAEVKARFPGKVIIFRPDEVKV